MRRIRSERSQTFGFPIGLTLGFRLGLTISLGLGLVACDPDETPSTDAGPTPEIDAMEPVDVDAGAKELVWEQSFDTYTEGFFLNIWGPAADDLYVVGGTPEVGQVVHYDGTAWTPLTLGVDVPLLNWAYGFGPDDITIVGNGGTVIHWDGASWSLQETPTEQDLWGVWGAAPDDLWSVGGGGREPGQQTLLHFDGESWSEAEVPELERANVYAFYKVWGTAADNIYVVGQSGVVLHYDGATWTEEFAGVSDDLVSVWGSSPDNIIAVGGRGSAAMSVWDGSTWEPLSIPTLPGLNGVWVDAEGIAYIVGVDGVFLRLDVASRDYDDGFAALPQLAAMVFHAAFSPDGTTVYGVGGNLGTSIPQYYGIVFEAKITEE
ncbi:sialidase family protein [Haliangium ochraceum]|uniref:Photosynthesis system II assembly factor Ycf48/Hcf136-like domain-containing protein n=1 Tax=Haliangium ochraceum (strain DSM 14365 / JCM 11303 / SMP-2) TaxID=502025 RepID=D0LGR4_HALO1|nr:hypothetical protein [Haliangium ochraceum]ACY14636.1 hypothetical protein Hoch_2091 [Haliangium ochraceum DSM 14365]